MHSSSKVTWLSRMSATLCGMLMSAPVRLRSFGIDCRFGGQTHWQELLAVPHRRPEPYSDYPLCRCHHAVHLVGLRRSLVRCLGSAAIVSNVSDAARNKML